MADSITLIMFIVPLVIAVIFSLLAVTPKSKDEPQNLFSGGLITLLSSVLASIAWFIFGLTWPALATTEMLQSIGLLWFALGVVFALFAAYVGLRMMGSIFETKPSQTLTLKVDD